VVAPDRRANVSATTDAVAVWDCGSATETRVGGRAQHRRPSVGRQPGRQLCPLLCPQWPVLGSPARIAAGIINRLSRRSRLVRGPQRSFLSSVLGRPSLGPVSPVLVGEFPLDGATRQRESNPCRARRRRAGDRHAGKAPVARGSDDRLTPRQEAVLASIAASHPRPISSAQLATELQLPAGPLNITLRSLHRRRVITPTPGSARRGGGWTLANVP
jgi:hypothetical protein